MRIARLPATLPADQPHSTSPTASKLYTPPLVCKLQMSEATTRRTLQQRTLAELRTMAQELQLPASGRKSAIIDRIYRHSRQRSDQDEVHPTPSRPQPRTPGSARDSTADLERTVQRMLENSIQELESRLLQHLVPPPPPEEQDNLSLPSQIPDHGPRTTNLTLRREDSTDGDPQIILDVLGSLFSKIFYNSDDNWHRPKMVNLVVPFEY